MIRNLTFVPEQRGGCSDTGTRPTRKGVHPRRPSLPVRAYDFNDSLRDADAVLDAAFVAARGEASESAAELKSL